MDKYPEFRAWNKHSKKMEYFNMRTIAGHSAHHIGYWWNIEGEPVDHNDLDELELSLNIHDKNKKDIYEGDICKCNAGGDDFFFEVGFQNGCFVAKVDWIKPPYSYPDLKLYCDMSFMTIEVIGNKFENHELLEGVRNG